MKMSDTELEVLAALHALGALTQDEEETLARLVSADESSAAMVDEYREVAAQIAFSLEPVSPPPQILDSLLLKLAKTHESDSAEPAPGIRVVNAAAGWQDHAIPGLRYKELARDEPSHSVTVLMTLAPGTGYPAHDHSGPEQCLVVSGSFEKEKTLHRAGDFIDAAAGTSDKEMYSEEGTTLLVVMSSEDFAKATSAAG